MPIRLLGPVNEIINKTLTEIIDSDIHHKAAGVVNTFVNSVTDVVDDTLKKVKDITKPEETE